MRKECFILAFFLGGISISNAQEVKTPVKPLPQQPSHEESHFMQYDMPGLEHTAMPYNGHVETPMLTYATTSNVALLDSSTYKYQPLHLPFIINSSNQSYIGLMDVRSVSGSVRYDLGRLTLAGGLTANRFLYYGNSVSQYGVSGRLSYSFSPNLSMTFFGEYYSSNPFISMAAYPYIPTTKYGGYMTVKNDRFFIDLGVEQRYNTIARKMETVPIITPGFKVPKKLVIGLPFGDFAKYLFMESAPRKQRPMAPPRKK